MKCGMRQCTNGGHGGMKWRKKSHADGGCYKTPRRDSLRGIHHTWGRASPAGCAGETPTSPGRDNEISFLEVGARNGIASHTTGNGVSYGIQL